MLARFDKWLGDTLFIPPVIALCQWIGCTQYLVANLATFAGVILLFHDITVNGTPSLFTTVMAVIAGLLLITVAIMYGARPGMQTSPSVPFWRYLAMFFIANDILFVIVGVRDIDSGRFFWPLFLLAEYARSIDTIPPREVKEKETEAKLQPAKARE